MLVAEKRWHVITASMLLALLFTLTGYRERIASAQTTEDSNFLTDTNTFLGLTFKYPSNWKITGVDQGQTPIHGFITLESPDKVAAIFISSGPIGSNESGQNLDYHAKKYIQISLLNTTNPKLIELSTNTHYLSGHLAARIIDSYSYPEMPMQNFKKMELLTVVDNKLYMVGYEAPPEKFPNYLQTAQTIIDSFQIISRQ